MSVVITETGAVTVSFSGGVMSFADPTNAQAPIYKQVPIVTANSGNCTFGQALLPTTATVVTLPAIPTQLVYGKHLGATGTITFTWTPSGGSSAVVQVIQPGGVIFFFNPTNGVTALTVQASVANTPIDYVLAG